jgi:translation initiation factor 3 subunit G
MADGGAGEMMNKRRDENSVRVSNLSEDVTEDDLAELFGPFGPIQRIFVAKDRETGGGAGAALGELAMCMELCSMHLLRSS